MIHLPSDDQKLQAFLRQHRPVPPPAQPDLEEQFMQLITPKAIAFNPNTTHKQTNLAIAKPKKLNRIRQLWLIPSTIAAGLLITWSSSRLLLPTTELANANLESFLETNWNDVIGDTATNPASNNLQNDWILETHPIN
jgi:hypothetical protein